MKHRSSPAPRPKTEKLAWRLSHIIARLHQGDVIDKHLLAREFGVDVRTIERDLNERLDGIAERNKEGQWQLTHSARSTIPANRLTDYARLAGTDKLFPNASLSYLLDQLSRPNTPHPLHVQPLPAEDLSAHRAVFEQLEVAVQARHSCAFTYKGKARQVEPYRLIYKTGVWYLAATETGRLKNFSVALIESLQVDKGSRFIPIKKHQDYINTKDDVWFTEETTEVLLRVSSEAAHYFARRPLLPQQQQRADSDGSLLVTAHINHPQQLLPIVRHWLPHVRIVQPMAWHETLVAGLQQALTQWGESTSPHVA
ncbi:helix-turn-helix transcriptional regulator [uncultured Comamonas sp.]|uniref:helix-turn-helix transcriptional regulator n=1 Tax=uncultured Comamonas sp. TaxID=114710 RepID=UPI003747ED4C